MATTNRFTVLNNLITEMNIGEVVDMGDRLLFQSPQDKRVFMNQINMDVTTDSQVKIATFPLMEKVVMTMILINSEIHSDMLKVKSRSFSYLSASGVSTYKTYDELMEHIEDKEEVDLMVDIASMEN